MSEAIFFEQKSKKLKSFVINFVLIYGLFFFELPGQENLPASVQQLDVVLSVIFGVPLAFQFFGIFQPTYLKFEQDKVIENITFLNSELKKQEIIGYRFIKLLFTYYILIDIKNPKQYIEGQSFWKKWISWYNFKQVRTPIKISLSRLDQPVGKIYESIKQVQKI